MTGVLTVPGFILFGQRTISGLRMPPSYKKPLPARQGVLWVAGVFGVSGTCSPPLSEQKTTMVFSLKWSASIFSSTRPTASSSVSTIAA